MKNLKKVLALVVALTMVLGTVSFAFTDVDTENEIYTAVQTLSSLDILKGYEDGTFGAEKDITRAEFAAVVCRALGMEASANGAKGATQFIDVPADHWASGYINLANGQGIVNGYGDGKFGPEDNVTFEQAVKMLVVALGFEPMAVQKGGYPTGYLVIANQYGMTKGVSAAGAANRGVVAQLTFNALDMPMMTQTGWGTNTEFKVQDGEGSNGYKTLLTVLEVEKLDGVITKTPSITGDAEDDFVNFKIQNIDAEKSHFVKNTTAKLYIAEDANYDEYFGMNATVYAKEFKKDKFEIIAIMPGSLSEVITIKVADLEDSINALGDNTVRYFESDSASKSKKIELDSSIYSSGEGMIYNYEGTTYATVTGWDPAVIADEDIELTFINNDDDSKFDMIIAKEYTYDYIVEVESERNRLNLKANSPIRFDFENEGIINKLFDKDGNAIAMADFAEDDVIAYMVKSGSSTVLPTWIEVINLGKNVVTGTVTELNDNNNTVGIDDVVYDYTGITPKVGEEGTFFLTMDGTIFNKDTSKATSSNFAYILEAGYGAAGAFSNAWQLRLLTKDGIQTYTMKDNFTIYKGNETAGVLPDTTYSKDGSNADYAWANSDGTAAAPSEFVTIKNAPNHKTGYTNRLVSYKLDANNDIKELRFFDTTATDSVHDVALLKEFKATAQTIDGKVLADNLVVFNIDFTNALDSKVADLNLLVDETEYKGLLAKADANDTEYNCFVIETGAAAIDYSQAISVVEGVSKSTNAAGEEVIRINYHTADADGAQYIEAISGETTVIGATVATIAKGDIIMFAADSEKFATDITVLAKVDASVSSSAYYGDDFAVSSAAMGIATDKDEDNEFIVGYIDSWRTGNNGRAITFVGDTYKDNGNSTDGIATKTTGSDEVVFTGSANGYTFVNNTAGQRGYILPGDWMADDVDVDNGTACTFFFARVYNGVVTDVVVLGDKATIAR